MSSIGAIVDIVRRAPQRASIFLQDNPLDVLEFDAILSEAHQGDATITDHPVEEGSDISDHVRVEPESLTANVMVTNHPIIVGRTLRAQPSIRGGDPNSRAEDAYGFLKELKDGAKVVGFSTTLRDYDNMLISSLGITRDATSGNIADMTLTIRQIKIANTETVEAPEPTNPSRKNKTNLGKKPKTEATPATEQKTQSILANVFSSFGG